MDERWESGHLARRLRKVELWRALGREWCSPDLDATGSLQLPVKTVFTRRGERRQGQVKLRGAATVRQSRKAGEGDQRIECDTHPLDPETQGLRREVGVEWAVVFHPSMKKPRFSLRLPLPPSRAALFVPLSFVYDGKGWVSPNPADTSSLCLALPSHLGKPRAASQNVPEG